VISWEFNGSASLPERTEEGIHANAFFFMRRLAGILTHVAPFH